MSPFYNTLLSIHEVSNGPSISNVNRLLVDLSHLLVKYRLHYFFGIALVHRHFILAEDEQMVDLTSTDSENIVTSVFKNGLPDSKVVDNFNLHVPSLPKVVPSRFLVRKSELVAYEFMCADEDRAREYSNLVNRITPQFRADWVAVAEKVGVTDRFGLAALVAGEQVFRREESYMKERLSIHRRKFNTPSECIPTVWYVGDGTPRVCRDCDHCDE